MTGFDARKYGFWFVRLSDSTRCGWLGGAMIVALMPYVLALALVTPFGKAGLYLRTPAFYIGAVGVALVVAASTRGVEMLTDGLTELEKVVLPQTADATGPGADRGSARRREPFHSYADTRLAAAAGLRPNVIYALPIAALGAALVIGALLHWHHTGVVDEGGGWHAFPLAWRATGALVPAALALTAFAVAVVLTFGGSMVLLVRNLCFAWGLRHYRCLPFPGRVRLGIRPLVTAYTWASATWMAGVALFVLFFFREWSTANIVGIVVLSVIGGLTFLVPYASFRRILDDTHEAMATLLYQAIEHRARDKSLQIDNVAEFTAANAAINEDPPPVLTRRGAIAYGVVQILAVTGILAKEVIQEQVSFLAHDSSR
jgi:hypothetical protein